MVKVVDSYSIYQGSTPCIVTLRRDQGLYCSFNIFSCSSIIKINVLKSYLIIIKNFNLYNTLKKMYFCYNYSYYDFLLNYDFLFNSLFFKNIKNNYKIINEGGTGLKKINFIDIKTYLYFYGN